MHHGHQDHGEKQISHLSHNKQIHQRRQGAGGKHSFPGDQGSVIHRRGIENILHRVVQNRLIADPAEGGTQKQCQNKKHRTGKGASCPCAAVTRMQAEHTQPPVRYRFYQISAVSQYWAP